MGDKVVSGFNRSAGVRANRAHVSSFGRVRRRFGIVGTRVSRWDEPSRYEVDVGGHSGWLSRFSSWLLPAARTAAGTPCRPPSRWMLKWGARPEIDRTQPMRRSWSTAERATGPTHVMTPLQKRLTGWMQRPFATQRMTELS